MTKFYLIRHGETDWNNKKILMGQTDIPLNSLGEKQVKSLAAFFKNIPCDYIYSSDLSRARSTAAAIAAEKSMDLVIDQSLRECSAGKLEGFNLAKMTEQYPDEVKLYRQDEMHYTPPGGESRVEFINRVSNFFSLLLERHQNKSLAIITHGGVIRAILSHILVSDFKNVAPQFSHLFRVDNCSVSLLKYSAQWEITFLNDINHLRFD